MRYLLCCFVFCIQVHSGPLRNVQVFLVKCMSFKVSHQHQFQNLSQSPNSINFLLLLLLLLFRTLNGTECSQCLHASICRLANYD